MSFYGDIFSTIAFNVNPQAPDENDAPVEGTRAKFRAASKAPSQKPGRKRRVAMPPPLDTTEIGAQSTSSTAQTPTLQERGLLTPHTPANMNFPRNFEMASPPHFETSNAGFQDAPDLRIPVLEEALSLRSPFVHPQDNQDLPLFDSLSTSSNPVAPSSSTRPFTPFSEVSPSPETVADAIPRGRRSQTEIDKVMLDALNALKSVRSSPLGLLMHVLWSIDYDDPLFFAQDSIYRKGHEDALFELLDTLNSHKRGHNIMSDWVRTRGLSMMCDMVHKEMESVKPDLYMATTITTPEFLDSWDINAIMDPVQAKTPIWTAILNAATDPDGDEDPEDDKSTKNRSMTRKIISSQVHFVRSRASSKVQTGISIAATAMGAGRSLIDILNHAGLGISHNSISKVLTHIGNLSVEEASKIADSLHSDTYDNLNTTGSVHVEQRTDGPSKVRSGTFAMIYELLNAKRDDMLLEPLLDNFKKSSPLKMSDLRKSPDQTEAYLHQSAVNVTEILFRHQEGFDYVKKDPLLQHRDRRRMPDGHKTKFYPLKVSTIEEASIDGNLHVHDDIYIHQMGKDPKTLGELAIPAYNDQLTNARIRGAQLLRQEDVNNWERRSLFQLGFGVFHMVMNLIWAILTTHRGKVDSVGSLAYWFSVMQKVRLGSDRPDYYTLLSALTQILDGLILSAWATECGIASLDEYAKSKPTAEELLAVAQRIVAKYSVVRADENMVPTDADAAKKKMAAANGPQDPVEFNTRLLTRDLLYVAELVSAIAIGDFGRIEDILPDVACMFRGAGCNNYANEILYFLFNLKEVWTPEFANIMRDNMLVNPSGRPGHWMPIDLNIEHHIGYLKALFMAKGIYANWDRLSDISAAINHIQTIKRQVIRTIAGYKGSKHTDADTTSLVLLVARKARDEKLQMPVDKRTPDVKPTSDIRQAGHRKMETSTLATFNKRIFLTKTFGDMSELEEEQDEISVPVFTTESDEDQVDALH